MSRSRTVVVVGISLAVLALAACAPANDLAGQAVQNAQLPGFWRGLWHGLIAPITLIVSWFSDSVGIYAVHNRGGWYDFGFMLGLSIVFGGTHGPGAYRGGRRGRNPRRGRRRAEVSDNE